jgi:hypothetical protein
MTYRVYVRWPNQRVSLKTSTASKAVADAAWAELKLLEWKDDNKPVGLAYTFRENGKAKPVQVEYIAIS